ncbi:MAG: phenylalanine--tRNA ligase subunit beta [Desulfobulbus sp.]
MKFTLSWLNQFVATEGWTAAALADKLTMLGLEVDGVEALHAQLEALVTARVISVEKHPDADTLSVCSVETGQETLQIVCGAPNVRAGMLAALAKVGTRLSDGNKIKKAKIRGVESAGMLCSARELGLSEDHDGILDLGDVPVGISLLDAMHLRDAVIEVDLTPNRADCASVRGIAREVSGFTGNALQPLVRQVTPLTGTDVDFSVEIQDPQLCLRYAARKLTQVKIGPSPLWMQQRLSAVGMRPINNIVDITNYVMLEAGQPLHAFDFETLRGSKIVVRRPLPEETTFTTLDGNQRQLDPEMLLICDGERPVALAGVMGGLETEITASSTTVLLESACFDPLSVRRTARKLGLPSESSYRFERGVDPNLADSALERAVELLVQYADARPDPDGIDLYPGKKEPIRLQLRAGKVCGLIGLQLTRDEIAGYLRGIEFAVTPLDETTLDVVVPSFRMDIEREVDLVEEVARLVGYDEIPTTHPVIRMEHPGRDPLRDLRRDAARCLIGQGFFEAINYSFIAESSFDLCRLGADDFRRKVTRLRNPLSEEQAVMRSLLLPGLLDNIRRNTSFHQDDIRLFEIGKVFWQHQAHTLPEERFQLCAVVSGQRYPYAEPLYFADEQADIFDIKGTVVHLLQTLRRAGTDGDVVFSTAEPLQPYCSPDCGALVTVHDKVVGLIGAVHPETLKRADIKQPVFFLELDLELLLTVPVQPKQFRTLPKYPSVKRDLSLVVADTVPAGNLLAAVKSQQQKYLESVEIFDVYRGKPIPAGQKSVSLAFVYRSEQGTLEDQTVDKAHNKIVTSLMADFQARYREGFEE